MLRHALLGAALAAALTLPHAVAAQASTHTTMYFDAAATAVDDGTRAATLDQLDGLGVRALRVTLPWAAVAPDGGSRCVPRSTPPTPPPTTGVAGAG
jgi:hypothetical protein